MILRRAWAAAGLLVALTGNAADGLARTETEGRELAQRLLEQRPAENFTNSGVLKIRDSKGRRIEIPVRFETRATPTNWQAVYFASGTNRSEQVTLAVLHEERQPNVYCLATAPATGPPTNEAVRLTGAQAMIPFAGSDFWLADLGLEFLHWPMQRMIKKEIKRGQSCYVLESRSPVPDGGYARVVSWLDIDSARDAGQAAIVQAEAYDAKGKLLKEFEPKGVRKVKGQWQLEAMAIRNVQTGSRTRLEFAFEPE